MLLIHFIKFAFFHFIFDGQRDQRNDGNTCYEIDKQSFGYFLSLTETMLCSLILCIQSRGNQHCMRLDFSCLFSSSRSSSNGRLSFFLYHCLMASDTAAKTKKEVKAKRKILVKDFYFLLSIFKWYKYVDL